MTEEPPAAGGSLAQILEDRRRKATLLNASGVRPWGVDFTPDHSCKEAADLAPSEVGVRGTEVAVAGRILRLRPSGGITFADIFDATGRLQLLASADGEKPQLVEQLGELDLGDIVGARGVLTRTRRGEPSLELSELALLAKALRPPAGKHTGVVDTELRYRRRYLDLLTTPEHRVAFRQRSAVVRSLRRTLDERGFLEVETPILQPIPGGGEARPFRTHPNSLATDLYLRIALELYLKRLLVAGFERVYEVGRVFRNEGLSPRHNPEFTLLEAYQAYGDMASMMELCEAMVAGAAAAAAETGPVPESVRDLTPPFPRRSMAELVGARLGVDPLSLWARPGELADRARASGASGPLPDTPGELLFAIYEELVEPTIETPIFVTDYPVEVSPLARRSVDPRFCERFELVVQGRELANAFSELNDPLEQRRRLEEQARRRERGNLEVPPFDEDFVEALEHGMPPAGGIGLGVERLVMLLVGAPSIRDVVLFPTLRPE